MEIEGLKDRILLLHYEGVPWEKYLKILKLKDYEIQAYSAQSINSIPKLTFDLVVIFLDIHTMPAVVLTELKKQFLAPSTPCIVLTDQEYQSDILEFPNVHKLSYKDELSRFQVNVQVQLRLRKVRSEHIKSQVEVVSENASLRDLNSRFQKDLVEAREIHEKILPNKLPEFAKIRCASAYLPLELVGGDLFDIWEIDEDTMGVFLGDITGHGLPAAFIASMTKMCLALAPKSSPSDALNFVNKELSRYLPDGRFISAVYCIINQKEKTLVYANAGHPPPIHFIKSSNQAKTLTQRGMPLNIDHEIPFSTQICSLEAGDMILLYSDGIYETVNMENKMLGIQGLADAYQKFAESSDIEEVIENLIDFQREYSQGRMYRDDITLIGIEIL